MAQNTINSNDIKNYAIISVLGIGALVGSIFLVKNTVQNVREGKASKDILDDAEPESFANRLHMAFENDLWFGAGTDEEAIYQAFNDMKSKAFYDKVIASYKKLYQEDLNTRLSDELSSTEFQKVQQIIRSKPLK